MRACRFTGKRPLMGTLVVGMLALGVSVYGQEFHWQPMQATVPATIDDQEGAGGVSSITVSGVLCNAARVCFGGDNDGASCTDDADCTGTPDGFCVGAAVEMNVRMSGWGNAPGSPSLGTYQITHLGSSYATGSGDDLFPLGWDSAPGIPSRLAYGADVDITHPEFVFAGVGTPLPAKNLNTLSYSMGCGILGGGSKVDDGGTYYGAHVWVEIPDGAAGTYTMGLNPSSNFTFMNDPTGTQIPGGVVRDMDIIIPTGKCCSDIGPGTTVCEDGVSETTCACSRPPPAVFTPGATCVTGDPAVDCPTCLVNSDCDDNNVCTQDTCNPDGTCTNDPDPIYDDSIYCCDPISGGLTVIDDLNECTQDVCNADGTVDHNPLTGTSCTHVNPCVINDVCDAGVCVGDLPADLMIPCPGGDPDCPAGWFCNINPAESMFGYCDCRLTTPIEIGFEPGTHPDGNCYDEGDMVSAFIDMGAGTSVVTGGQFLIEYDPTCLEFQSIGPCPGDTLFLTVIDSDDDAAAGTIWYAVVALDPADPEVALGGTTGPYHLACIDFMMKDSCDACNVCLISENPRNTKLTDQYGDEVEIDLGIDGCSKDIRLDGSITLNVPDGDELNSDCRVPTATTTWGLPNASDSCDGTLDVVCVSEHDGGIPVGHLTNGGGEFPQGVSFFRCDTTNSCGSTTGKVWTVSVSNQQSVDVDVRLSPTMDPGNFTRCICFDIYADICSAPDTQCVPMSFGPPYDFQGQGRDSLKIDKGSYVCITAEDPLHTLRSAAVLECVDDTWEAVFKGDPLMDGGSWLVGGNLDGSFVIDVLDAGMYMADLGTNYGTGDTACGEDAPHGDINADGIVDGNDYAFIVENFLAMAKDACCPDPAAGRPVPVLDISIKELRARGLGYLSVADLNNDGRLNLEDMDLYSQGVVPDSPVRVKRANSTR